MARSHSRPFAERYLQGDLGEFFALAPDELEAALDCPRAVDRAGLAAILQRQAEALAAPEAVFAQLKRLAHPDSRAVVTGQQTGLLLGPLYTISKAMTAIRLARQLDTAERPVVPIFWMASQDHDGDEIDHAYLLDNDEVLHRLGVTLPAEVPAGKVTLEPALVSAVLRQLEDLSVPAPHRAEVGEMLTRTAARAATFAGWFGALLYELLGPYGIVVLDPLEPAMASLFAPVLRRELEEPTASTEAIRAAGRRLRRLGESPQLGRGAGATNLFLELAGDGGPVRTALRYVGGSFVAASRRLSREALIDRLEADATALTPAAGLRPVTQDAALPTAVTVVGPGELRYFAQLAGVFAHHGVAMPLIWPRAEALVLEPPVRRILARYRLAAADYLEDPEGHRDRAVLELHGHAARFGAALERLDEEVATLLAATERLDPTLLGAVARGRGYLENTVTRLRDKTAAALTRRDEITRRQFARLDAHLLPLGQPQERLISPFSYILKFGLDGFRSAVEAIPTRGTQLLTFAPQPPRDSE